MPFWQILTPYLFAEKKSTTIFFFYFFKEEKYSNKFLGVIENSRILLINNDLKKFDELNSVIINQFGSNDKFCELKDLEAYKDSVSNMRIEKAKQILKSSYTEWLKYFPTDTIKALDVFLDELEELVAITPRQRTLLYENILGRLRKWDFNNFSGSGISFLAEDIGYDVQSVLTMSQYCDYLKKRVYKNLEKSVAGNILYFYYSKDKRIPDARIDNTIKQEVFR